MLSRRSILQSAAVLTVVALPAIGQGVGQGVGRVIDEGTFNVTRPGAPAATESFRIRMVDNGLILATGQLIAGSKRINSALTTDTLGTPVEYRVEVRENGAPMMTVSAVARAGRLSARSQLARGDESMREYPAVAGHCVVLDDELFHQMYFVTLAKRTGPVQVIKPRTSHGGTLKVQARGLEPITLAGRQVTATHYTLVNGTARDFWVDAAGRVLQVEVPSTGIKATREELPR
jgi:hypothetical protein